MILRRLSLAATLALAALLPVRASQQDLVLPTSGLVSAVEFSALITNALAALNSCNSGTTAPTNASGGTPIAGQCWLDTSSTPLVKKIYDGTSWLTIGSLDATGNIWMPPVGGGTVSIASAATTDICSAVPAYVTITGNVTITSLGGTACVVGQVKILKFTGTLTLTHNASTLALPGSANISIGAGDMAIAVKASATKWEVANHMAAATPSAALDSTRVPIGTMLDYAGFVPPTDYEFCGGQAISRATYSDYFAAVTIVKSAVRTSGQTTLTSVAGGTEGLGLGKSIEGTGIAAGATISALGVGSIVMSAAATSSGTGDVTVFAVGNGNGSTTVSTPDARGRVKAGRDDMNAEASRLTVGTAANCDGKGLGTGCGAQTGVLIESMLPVVSKTVNITISGTTSSSGTHSHSFVDNGFGENTITEGTAGDQEVANDTAQNDNTDTAGAHTHTFSGSDSDTVEFGSGAAHSKLQPTLVSNCIVRVR